MVGDDHTVTSTFYSFDRVLGILDTLEKERSAAREVFPLLDESAFSAAGAAVAHSATTLTWGPCPR